MLAAWAAVGKVDATQKNAMHAVYMSQAERRNSNGNSSRDLRQRNVDLGCPSMLRRSTNELTTRFHMRQTGKAQKTQKFQEPCRCDKQ
jgi:hypothetical protein